MPTLKLKVLCDSGRHCATCRDREGGRSWREAQSRLRGLAVDWECPMGHPWGYAPPQGLRLSIPADYDPKDYHRDSRGTEGCGCA